MAEETAVVGGGSLMDESAHEGEAMHTGMRLSEIRLQQRLSLQQPLLLPLHLLKAELLFHYQKLRETWGREHLITLGFGLFAFLLGSWDLGIGEQRSGGDIWTVGVNGLNSVSTAAFALLLLSYASWVWYLFRLQRQFPVVRGFALWMFIGWVAMQFGTMRAHAMSPRFPFDSDFQGMVWFAACAVVLLFIGYIFGQAVIQTRDVHVQTQHAHPDPRRMETAMRDHSLVAWTAVLVAWGVFIALSSWFGAHYLALRAPMPVGHGLFKVGYYLFGAISLVTMMHLLWYPQMMLGDAGQRIQSDRAREVTRDLRGEVGGDARQPGKCPACGAATPISRLADGELEVSCAGEQCHGAGKPSERCPECAAVLPTRISCENCGTSAPVVDHLPDDDAW